MWITPKNVRTQPIHMWTDCVQQLRSYSHFSTEKNKKIIRPLTDHLILSFVFAIAHLFEEVLKFFHAHE